AVRRRSREQQTPGAVLIIEPLTMRFVVAFFFSVFSRQRARQNDVPHVASPLLWQDRILNRSLKIDHLIRRTSNFAGKPSRLFFLQRLEEALLVEVAQDFFVDEFLSFPALGIRPAVR